VVCWVMLGPGKWLATGIDSVHSTVTKA